MVDVADHEEVSGMAIQVLQPPDLYQSAVTDECGFGEVVAQRGCLRRVASVQRRKSGKTNRVHRGARHPYTSRSGVRIIHFSSMISDLGS